MEKLDDVRKKKIEDMVTEAIAKAPKGGSGGGSAPAKPGGSGGAAAGRPPPSRTASTASGGASTSRPGTARSSPKALAPKNGVRPGTGAAAGKAGAGLRRAASSGVVTRSKAGGGGAAVPVEEDLSSGKLSNEELEGRMVETFGEGTGGPLHALPPACQLPLPVLRPGCCRCPASTSCSRSRAAFT
jgi:hypothetical protein